MTGYELSRNWFDWAFENPDLNTPTHTALYMWFIEKWNRCGQKDKISITTSESMEVLAISSRNTFGKVFKDLCEWGFINVITDSKNQYSCKVITLAQKMCKQDESIDKALDKALIQQGSKQSESIDASTDTINKQVNKEIKKQRNDVEKTKNVFTPPTILEVENYFFENGYKREAGTKAYNYYSVANWQDSKGNKVKNWKQKMQAVWFKDEHKIMIIQPSRQQPVNYGRYVID